MIDIFVIGSNGIPAQYGGFETFVDKLTKGRKSSEIKYHVACLSNTQGEFEYNDARCFNVSVPDIGGAKAILYDIVSLKKSIAYIKKNKLDRCIIYILGSTIGPFIGLYIRELKKMGIRVCMNLDGYEWKRSRWNSFIRSYLKFTERIMVRFADLLICDSEVIERYIKSEYHKYSPRTVYKAYGADLCISSLSDDNDKLLKWYEKYQISRGNYFLTVGRFVPENNYETIIREFMNSRIQKDLVLITNIKQNAFYKYLLEKTNFTLDKRIKFVGTVWDEQLLKKIRENAFAYIHGHEVGGTNPSLLEALASTNLNILLDVNFNKEVASDSAIYFKKDTGNMQKVLESTELLSIDIIDQYGKMAKQIIKERFLWKSVIREYEKLFIKLT